MSTTIDCPPETDTNPLKFERRRCDRWPATGLASAFRLSGAQFGQIDELELQDYGPGGMAGLSDAPIDPGTEVSLGFSDTGLLARRGVVRRCTPCGTGYRVAIQFEMRMAA